jgi:hypothetical protein
MLPRQRIATDRPKGEIPWQNLPLIKKLLSIRPCIDPQSPARLARLT